MRKKKLLWLVVIIALAGAAWQVGLIYALAVAAALTLALIVLFTAKWILAGQGLGRLRAERPKYGFPTLIEGIRRRYPQAPDTFTFVVLGDTRNKVRIAAEVYRRAAGESPTMIFHTGDIVRHGSPQEFLNNHVRLLAITDPAPMFCVPGNHDRGVRRDFSAFKTLYGDDRFAFDFGACRFVGFNNSTRERMDEATLAWLKEALSKPGAVWKYVFLHIPPAYFEETFVSDTRRRGFTRHAEAFHRIMQEEGVNEVFMAHIHGYASTVIDGVRYTLTAGGGAPLSRRLEPTGQAYNYVVMRVTPGEVRRIVVRGHGQEWTRTEEN